MHNSFSTLRSLSFFIITFLFLFSLAHADVLEYPSEEESIMTHYVNDYALKPLPIKTTRQIVKTVYKYSKESKIDPMLVLGIMRQESGFVIKAKSTEGASGLMQVLPRAHRAELKGKQVNDIETNVSLGVQIYASCLKRKGTELGAMNCYSGGGGKKYHNGVVAYTKHAQQYAIAKMFVPYENEDILLASN